MKANAPEKIYVVDATFPDYVDFDGSPINTKRIDDHDIEYTRTDAFIERAREWFEKQNEWIGLDGTRHCDLDEDEFEDFKNYMKNE